MKPVDLARKLRREAAFEPAALDRGKAVLMAAIRQEVEPTRGPTIVPQIPYEDVSAALSFLERAFGFREIPTARLVTADGGIDHAMLAFGGSVIGIGPQGHHGEDRRHREPVHQRVRRRRRCALSARGRRRCTDRKRAARLRLGRSPLRGASHLRGARPQGPPLALPPAAARGAAVQAALAARRGLTECSRRHHGRPPGLNGERNGKQHAQHHDFNAELAKLTMCRGRTPRSTMADRKGSATFALDAGMMVVIPQGGWHRFHSSEGVTLMTATRDDPRT